MWIPRDDDIADSVNVERDDICSEGAGAGDGVYGLGCHALWAYPAEVILEVRMRGMTGRGGGVGDEGGAAAKGVARNRGGLVRVCAGICNSLDHVSSAGAVEGILVFPCTFFPSGCARNSPCETVRREIWDTRAADATGLNPPKRERAPIIRNI